MRSVRFHYNYALVQIRLQSRTDALRHTDLAQIAQKTGRFLLVRSSAPHSTEHLLTPPATYYFHCLTHSYKSTCNPQQSLKSIHNRRTRRAGEYHNPPQSLRNPSNLPTIGEHNGPEDIEQEYRRPEVAPRPEPFSDCVGIPDYPTVEPQWLSIHRFCRNLANHNTMS